MEGSMSKKDLYAELCKYYEFMLGEIPNKEKFIEALKQTISEDELKVFFLLPFSGSILHEKLVAKASKVNISESEMIKVLKRIAPEGYILSYDTPAGRSYERGNPVFMTEQQVRKQSDSNARTIFAEFMDTMIESSSVSNKNKTPYYRVLPVEHTITGKPIEETITLDIPVPDPRQVLPIDVVTEMVKTQSVVGVAECFCRKARKVVGKECSHPLETCFVFNEFAEGLIECGLARKTTIDEALQILRHCEEVGLVHNVDNAEGHLRTLCNCCTCSCIVLNVIKKGGTNAGAPSRFLVDHDEAKCIACEECIDICPTNSIHKEDGKIVFNPTTCLGCGLCTSKCKQHANHMIERKKYPRIYPTHKDLWNQIGKESIIGILKDKVLGK
jgi:Pyruvate/2-oxoacid:ferredoxin oxidoreductase delta subunit